MTRVISKAVFLVAVLFVVAMFITSKSYEQLGLSVVLYPLVAYFAYTLFVCKKPKSVITPAISENQTVATSAFQNPVQQSALAENSSKDVVDIDKRAFLKIVGATGLSYLVFSILGKRIETSIFQTTGNAFQSSSNNRAPEPLNTFENYRITEIGYDNLVTYYGFVSNEGSWIIMKEDSGNNSFRYSSGDANFESSWNIRETLRYVYFHDLQI